MSEHKIIVHRAAVPFGSVRELQIQFLEDVYKVTGALVPDAVVWLLGEARAVTPDTPSDELYSIIESLDNEQVLGETILDEQGFYSEWADDEYTIYQWPTESEEANA